MVDIFWLSDLNHFSYVSQAITSLAIISSFMNMETCEPLPEILKDQGSLMRIIVFLSIVVRNETLPLLLESCHVASDFSKSVCLCGH